MTTPTGLNTTRSTSPEPLYFREGENPSDLSDSSITTPPQAAKPKLSAWLFPEVREEDRFLETKFQENKIDSDFKVIATDGDAIIPLEDKIEKCASLFGIKLCFPLDGHTIEISYGQMLRRIAYEFAKLGGALHSVCLPGESCSNFFFDVPSHNIETSIYLYPPHLPISETELNLSDLVVKEIVASLLQDIKFRVSFNHGATEEMIGMTALCHFFINCQVPYEITSIEMSQEESLPWLREKQMTQTEILHLHVEILDLYSQLRGINQGHIDDNAFFPLVCSYLFQQSYAEISRDIVEKAFTQYLPVFKIGADHRVASDFLEIHCQDEEGRTHKIKIIKTWRHTIPLAYQEMVVELLPYLAKGKAPRFYATEQALVDSDGKLIRCIESASVPFTVWISYVHGLSIGLRCVNPKKFEELNQKLVKQCKAQENPLAFIVSSLFQEWRNHGPQSYFRLVAYHFNACALLFETENYFNDEDFSELWKILHEGFSILLEPEESQFWEHPLGEIVRSLSSGEILFSNLYAFLQVQAFRWLSSGQPQRNFSISLTFHGHLPALKIVFDDATLHLPFNPMKALSCLQNQREMSDLDPLRKIFALLDVPCEEESALLIAVSHPLYSNIELFKIAIPLLEHPLETLRQYGMQIMKKVYTTSRDKASFELWLENLPGIWKIPSFYAEVVQLIKEDIGRFYPSLSSEEIKKLLVFLKNLNSEKRTESSFAADLILNLLKIKPFYRIAFSLWQNWGDRLTQQSKKSNQINLAFFCVYASVSSKKAFSFFSKKVECNPVNEAEIRIYLRNLVEIMQKETSFSLSEQTEIYACFIHCLNKIHSLVEPNGPLSNKFLTDMASLFYAQILKFSRDGKNNQAVDLALAAHNFTAAHPLFLKVLHAFVAKPHLKEEAYRSLLDEILVNLKEANPPFETDFYIFLFEIVASSARDFYKSSVICREAIFGNLIGSPHFAKTIGHALLNGLVLNNETLTQDWLKACKDQWKKNLGLAASLWLEGANQRIWDRLSYKEEAQFLVPFANILQKNQNKNWEKAGLAILSHYPTELPPVAASKTASKTSSKPRPSPSKSQKTKQMHRGVKQTRVTPKADLRFTQGQGDDFLKRAEAFLPIATGFLKEHRDISCFREVFPIVDRLIEQKAYPLANRFIRDCFLPNIPDSDGVLCQELGKIGQKALLHHQYVIVMQIANACPSLKNMLLKTYLEQEKVPFESHPIAIAAFLLSVVNSNNRKECSKNEIKKIEDGVAGLLPGLVKKIPIEKNYLDNLKLALNNLENIQHPDPRLWVQVLEKIYDSKNYELCVRTQDIALIRLNTAHASEDWTEVEKMDSKILGFLMSAKPDRFSAAHLLKKVRGIIKENNTEPNCPKLNAILIGWLQAFIELPQNGLMKTTLLKVVNLKPEIMTCLAEFSQFVVDIHVQMTTALLKINSLPTLIQAEEIYLALIDYPGYKKLAKQEHIKLVEELVKRVDSLYLEQKKEPLDILHNIIDQFKAVFTGHPTINVDEVFITLCQISEKAASKVGEEDPSMPELEEEPYVPTPTPTVDSLESSGSLTREDILAKIDALCDNAEESGINDAESALNEAVALFEQLPAQENMPTRLEAALFKLECRRANFVIEKNKNRERDQPFEWRGIQLCVHDMPSESMKKEYNSIVVQTLAQFFIYPGSTIHSYFKKCLAFFEEIKRNYVPDAQAQVSDLGSNFISQRTKHPIPLYEISPRQFVNCYVIHQLKKLFKECPPNKSIDFDQLHKFIDKLLDSVDKRFTLSRFSPPEHHPQEIISFASLFLIQLLKAPLRTALQVELVEAFLESALMNQLALEPNILRQILEDYLLIGREIPPKKPVLGFVLYAKTKPHLQHHQTLHFKIYTMLNCTVPNFLSEVIDQKQLIAELFDQLLSIPSQFHIVHTRNLFVALFPMLSQEHRFQILERLLCGNRRVCTLDEQNIFLRSFLAQIERLDLSLEDKMKIFDLLYEDSQHLKQLGNLAEEDPDVVKECFEYCFILAGKLEQGDNRLQAMRFNLLDSLYTNLLKWISQCSDKKEKTFIATSECAEKIHRLFTSYNAFDHEKKMEIFTAITEHLLPQIQVDHISERDYIYGLKFILTFLNDCFLSDDFSKYLDIVIPVLEELKKFIRINKNEGAGFDTFSLAFQILAKEIPKKSENYQELYKRRLNLILELLKILNKKYCKGASEAASGFFSTGVFDINKLFEGHALLLKQAQAYLKSIRAGMNKGHQYTIRITDPRLAKIFK
jgi:hypothetical protein